MSLFRILICTTMKCFIILWNENQQVFNVWKEKMVSFIIFLLNLNNFPQTLFISLLLISRTLNWTKSNNFQSLLVTMNIFSFEKLNTCDLTLVGRRTYLTRYGQGPIIILNLLTFIAFSIFCKWFLMRNIKVNWGQSKS